MVPQRWDLSKSEAKLEQLAEVLKGAGKHPMLILCHNNPDPDSIGCAAGLNFLLKRKLGIRSVLGYGGAVTRAENKAMVHRLRIHLRRFQRLRPSAYYGIALVDGQPGTGNTLLSTDVPPLIVIDHHPLRKLSLKSPFSDVRKGYGATSTIVTEYLVAAGLTPSRLVAAALLYGIKTDTASLVRGAQEVDFLAFNYLSGIANPRMLGWIEKHILPKSASSLRIANKAVRMDFFRRIMEDLPRMESLYLKELMESCDANEGIGAFLERRKPDWKNE